MGFHIRSSLGIAGAILLLLVARDGCYAAEQPVSSVLPGVSFIGNTAVLEAGSESALDKLLEELTADTSVAVEIACHVTSSGDPLSDSKLSRLRAETLRRWLISRGVSFYRVAVADASTTAAGSAVSAESGAGGGDRVEITRIHQSYPIADIAEKIFRFEPVLEGQEVLHDFQLQNAGDGPLHISRVRTG